jgi:ribosomal protein S18 acetylase RimI-like enzyme
MQIMEANETHIPQIVKLWVEFFDYHSELDPFFTRSEDAEMHVEKRLRDRIADEDGQVLVAVEGERVVGYSLCWIGENAGFFKERKYGHICDLAVTASHRGKGTGHKLLERILAWFESRHIPRAALFVVSKNQPAVAFWTKHGFRPVTQVMEILLH